jgi:hypothetical protein
MGLLALLVHNEAIKTDPQEIYGWRVYALVWELSFESKGAPIDSL